MAQGTATERAPHTMIYVPGLGQSALFSVDAVAKSISSVADRMGAGRAGSQTVCVRSRS